MVGRQTPFLALIVPLILVLMVDGKRGVRQAWPAAAGRRRYLRRRPVRVSNYISVELTDIVAALASAAPSSRFMRVWQPGEPLAGRGRRGASGRPAVAGGAVARPRSSSGRSAARRRDARTRARDRCGAYAPYLIIIVVFVVAQIPAPVKDVLAKAPGPRRSTGPAWTSSTARASRSPAITFKLNCLPAAGTLLLISGLLTMLVLRVGPARPLRVYGRTLDQLKWAILTVIAVLALAYVMNLSGQTITLGCGRPARAAFFAFLSPLLGWLGVAVTGLGHVLELAVRRPAGGRREGRRACPRR